MSEEKLTMDDFSAELEASFKKIEEGDMLTGTVISVDEKEVILDLKYYAEGVIRAEDFSNEPGFSLKELHRRGRRLPQQHLQRQAGYKHKRHAQRSGKNTLHKNHPYILCGCGLAYYYNRPACPAQVPVAF